MIRIQSGMTQPVRLVIIGVMVAGSVFGSQAMALDDTALSVHPTKAYGFRDPEFLKLKILGIHETTYALVG